MKLVFPFLILMTATLAHAKAQEGYGIGTPALFSARQIYAALNVEPIAGSSFEQWWNEKSVGGLICRETRAGFPTAPATYSCDMDISTENDQAIYDALNVKEVAINPGITGSSAFAKSVATLTCTKRMIFVPHAVPSYACTLK